MRLPAACPAKGSVTAIPGTGNTTAGPFVDMSKCWWPVHHQNMSWRCSNSVPTDPEHIGLCPLHLEEAREANPL